ncbi:RNA polymerase sigma factor [Microbulbifer spongiae]|uniref:Sigma-70 family RNA polymerase sigma factor n=1 Tax=Microbulbifer spongiae TaxID=2944933 RepID=A0ABY9E8P2_9GAMM|nr:sigma-70 family RNA polymerase sigma factor [Microbulbifer sp. MI-G]WKD49380.1 sigma-70 family RNA polymerase sigma factor [Microbulbifer sp. MI-G]
MAADHYRQWLRTAARLSQRGQEAEDLLQEGLLAAVEAQRTPFQNAGDAAWFYGVLRNLAAMQARRTERRRVRETRYASGEDISRADSAIFGKDTIPCLPAAQRLVLLLTLNGLSKKEICRVLGISDAAMRQRLSALRKKLTSQRANGIDPANLAAAYAARLDNTNPSGAGLRRAVLAQGPARLPSFRFGITDPDSNLLSISQLTEQ